MTSPSSPLSQRPVLVRLQQEWSRLSRSPLAIDAARSWQLDICRLDSLDDVLEAAGYGHVRPGNHDDDEFLAILLRLARHHELAARVVLQRILPGLSTLARRRCQPGQLVSEVSAEIIAAAWAVVRSYPVDRRPNFVAANLIREIDYRTFASHRRRRTIVTVATGEVGDVAQPAARVEAADELAELLALAATAGMHPGDIELARRLGGGETTAELATSENVTDRTIRNRRTAVTRRLREVALAS